VLINTRDYDINGLGQSKQDVLIAGGSIALSEPPSVNILQFTFSNASWSTIGDSVDLPGPVTAVTVNNGNTSNIFAAGRCVSICITSSREIYISISTVLRMVVLLSWLPGMVMSGPRRALASGAPAPSLSSRWFHSKVNIRHKALSRVIGCC
jgi:hypothetical protein